MGIRGVKGGPRTPGSGRKKGTLNKGSLSLQEKLDAFNNGEGFDPVEEALKLFILIHADNPLVAVKIPLELMKYIYPTKKAVDHSVNSDSVVELARRLQGLPDQELLKLLPEAIDVVKK